MQVTGKVVVVTGGANGIGRALCEAFHRAGAAKVVVVDIDGAAARAVAAEFEGAEQQREKHRRHQGELDQRGAILRPPRPGRARSVTVSPRLRCGSSCRCKSS